MFAGVFNKTPVSYSRSCGSDQFCVGSNQLHAVCNPRALLRLSTCLLPSQASLLTQRQQATQEPAWCSYIHSPEGQGGNNLWGEILASGGWKRMDKGFSFSLPGQKVLYHIYTAARAFHGTQQTSHHCRGWVPITHLCIGSPCFPASLHVAPTPVPWLPFTSEAPALKLHLSPRFLGNPG